MSRLFPSLPAFFRQSVRRCQPVRPSFGLFPDGGCGSIPWFPSFDCNSIFSPFPGFVKGRMKKFFTFYADAIPSRKGSSISRIPSPPRKAPRIGRTGAWLAERGDDSGDDRSNAG